MIEAFIIEFNRFYSNRIVPKFHFLIHAPLYIKFFGTARQQWCLICGAAHNYFKSLVPVVRKFKNMPYTLAYRHQARLCLRLPSASSIESNNFLYQGHDVSVGPTLFLANLPNSHLFNEYVAENDRFNCDIMKTPEAQFHGTTYKNNDIILLKRRGEFSPGV